MVLAGGGQASRACNRGWACTSGRERGKQHQGKASGPGKRTGRRGRVKAKSNDQFDF